MTERTEKILYSPLLVILYALALLPLRVLYVISDVLYIIVFYIVRYRVSIAHGNIWTSFPDKSEKEKREILKKFYHHLCDYIVETIKLLHISDAEIRRRMVFEDAELFDQSLDNGKPIAIYLGHYGNWEWIPSVTLWVRHGKDPSVVFGQVYRRLRNRWFDNFFLKLRSRFSECIEKRNTLRDLLKYRKEGKLWVVGFMSDQHPSGDDIHHVINFLNHPTAMITGTEVLARRLDMDVLYFDIRKECRGYYRCKILRITSDSPAEPPMAITDAYAMLLQADIERQPELWLWTHKRWKHPAKYPVQPLTSLSTNTSKL